MAVPTEDFPAAARRCFRDGDLLLQHQRIANASHLFGLSAECALKVLLSGHRGADVPAKHLPQLRDHALRTLQRRQDRGIQGLLNQSDYMEGWQIEARYWPDEAVPEDRGKLHRDHCRRTLLAANLGT